MPKRTILEVADLVNPRAKHNGCVDNQLDFDLHEEQVEQWKSLNTIECSNHAVSSRGNIKNIKRNAILCQSTINGGMASINIRTDGGKHIRVFLHILVAAAFLPLDPTRPRLIHKNRIKSDNRVENLQRASVSEWKAHIRWCKPGQGYQRPVQAMENGSVVKSYRSLAAATHDVGVTNGALLYAMRRGSISAGFSWRYTPMDVIDGEIWKHIDTIGIDVSSHGRVKTMGGHVSYGMITYRSYRRIAFNKKMYYVHYLVAVAFHGPRPPGTSVDHIDRNKLNNHFENLRYATQSEQRCNTDHCELSGLNRPVYQFTPTFNLIGAFPSVKSAALFSNVRNAVVTRSCKNKRASSTGLVFRYKDDVLADPVLRAAAGLNVD